MIAPIPFPNPRRELARRVNGGLEVTLYWNAYDDSISIEVWQPATRQLSPARRTASSSPLPS
jgi:hypothetical protein